MLAIEDIINRPGVSEHGRWVAEAYLVDGLLELTKESVGRGDAGLRAMLQRIRPEIL